MEIEIVDVPRLDKTRFMLQSGQQWNLLINNLTDNTFFIKVYVNKKLVPQEWTIPPGKKTLEQNYRVKNYFTYKAPTKTTTAVYTQVKVLAFDERKKNIQACSLALVDSRLF